MFYRIDITTFRVSVVPPLSTNQKLKARDEF